MFLIFDVIFIYLIDFFEWFIFSKNNESKIEILSISIYYLLIQIYIYIYKRHLRSLMLVITPKSVCFLWIQNPIWLCGSWFELPKLTYYILTF